jgi:ATP/maltotriose-dependent transcriptional regulator MalT
MDAARRRGDQPEFRYLAILRSHTALYAGLLLEAEADGRTAVDLSDDGSQDTPMAVAVLAEALLERGRPDEAQQLLTSHGLEGELHVSFLSAHFVLQARGRLRLRQGRWAEAVADLRQCGAALNAGGFVNPAFAPWWRPGAALAHVRLGDRDAARELAAEDLLLARRFGAPFSVGNALRVAALIEGGDTGLDMLGEAVRAHEGTTSPLWLARTLADYGAALRRAGQRTQAQQPLREALDLATRAGAVELAAGVRDELVAAGARPRRALRTGPHALTASELRVARLAATGQSNRDIAQALFLSLRTVELHLTHAYRKLHISTRHQLAAILAGLSADD